jgi:hypothetical protein
VHEFYLMCADVDVLVAALGKQGVRCSGVENLGWGMRTEVELPGGGKLGIYQPRHARPRAMRARSRPARAGRRTRKPGHS